MTTSGTPHSPLRLSVVIPTLNEAKTLPGLLAALNNQTQPPHQIIVADAGSKDGTTEAARAAGAIVVPGGRPGPGRNAGARASSGNTLLFLDADVLPARDFIAGALREFEEQGFAVATCLIGALSEDASDRILAEATNLYLQMVQYFSPHAPGFCILARREVHEAIGGFDEQVKLSEDHDYVQRAAKHGEFGVLTSVRIPVSMRRIESEGLTRLAFKYLWCEMYALAGKPIYSTPFEYEFGAHEEARKRRGIRMIDIGELRQQLGRFDNPIQRLSEAGVEMLSDLAEHDWVGSATEQVSLMLDRADADLVDRYLRRRLAVIRKTGRPLTEALSALQNRPIKESIRQLDFNWLRKPFSSRSEDTDTPRNDL